MTADPIAALIKILQDNPDVSALILTRVYGDELPRTDADSMPRKCVVLKLSGGFASQDYMEHRTFRFDALSYGETPYEAGLVQRTVSPVLQKVGLDNQRVHDGVLIHWVNRGGGPLSLRDPDTDWPLKFESFECFHAEAPIV